MSNYHPKAQRVWECSSVGQSAALTRRRSLVQAQSLLPISRRDSMDLVILLIVFWFRHDIKDVLREVADYLKSKRG